MNRSTSPRLATLKGDWRRGALVLMAVAAVAAGCNDSGGTGTTPDYAITLEPTSLTLLP